VTSRGQWKSEYFFCNLKWRNIDSNYDHFPQGGFLGQVIRNGEACGNVRSHSVRALPAFYGTRRFITLDTGDCAHVHTNRTGWFSSEVETCIRGVLSADLRRDTDYPNWDFWWYFSVPPVKCRHSTSISPVVFNLGYVYPRGCAKTS
jgi:hypothetical protein